MLFGTLQTLADGTLFIGTGIREGVLRLDPGTREFKVAASASLTYLADPEGNLWTGGYARLGYRGRAGTPNFELRMPSDPRHCSNIPAYEYRPLAVDGAGGVWLRIADGATYVGETPPCDEPVPPPMPDLIRVNGRAILAAQASEHVPALSPFMLVAMTLSIAFLAVWHIARST